MYKRQQVQALLESPSPLEDVYRYFEKLETGYMDVIRDSIENRADDVCRACLLYTSDEVASLLRGMYARQQDGFGQEQPQSATESPTFHSETMAVYPGDKNNLPYDCLLYTSRCV